VITVTVNPEGCYFIGANQFSKETLGKELQKLLAPGGNRLVVVRADRRVQLDRAVTALDLAKAAGAERLSLATERQF
jgi:biopolymer transport protein ExbD